MDRRSVDAVLRLSLSAARSVLGEVSVRSLCDQWTAEYDLIGTVTSSAETDGADGRQQHRVSLLCSSTSGGAQIKIFVPARVLSESNVLKSDYREGSKLQIRAVQTLSGRSEYRATVVSSASPSDGGLWSSAVARRRSYHSKRGGHYHRHYHHDHQAGNYANYNAVYKSGGSDGDAASTTPPRAPR